MAFFRPGRARRSAARSTPARSELASEWGYWIARNLVDGVAPDKVLAHLVRQGMTRADAAAEIANILSSGAMAAARESARSARRFELVCRLLREQRSVAGGAAIARRPTPARDEFFDRYLGSNTPAIFTDLVTRWPAFAKWSPEYLAARFGDVEVRVTTHRESDPDYDQHAAEHTRAMRLADFVSRLLAAGESNDLYMVAQNRNLAHSDLRQLLLDVRLPEGWFEEAALHTGSALWFGPAGTVTPLHHDTSNILFCQVYGRKRLHLVAPLQTELLEDAVDLYSSRDPDSPDSARNLACIPNTAVVLAPGEALFIPVGWWHHVRALDVSISLAANQFTCPNDFDWYRPGRCG